MSELACAERPEAAGKVYHVAAPQPTTSAALLEEVARQLRVRAVRLRIPFAALYPLALGQEWVSRLTNKPNVFSRDKIAELRAPGWVCATDAIRQDLGFVAPTTLADGVARALAWYRDQGLI